MTIKENLYLQDKKSSIGAIRLSFGIVGGLISAYASICFLANFLYFSVFENIVIAVIILPFLWCPFSLWIILSDTKIKAIIKTLILLGITITSLLIVGKL